MLEVIIIYYWYLAKNVLFEFFICKRLEPKEKHSSNPTQDRTLRINLLFRTVRFPDFFNVLKVTYSRAYSRAHRHLITTNIMIRVGFFKLFLSSLSMDVQVHGHEDDINAVAFADSSSHILFSGGDDGLCKVCQLLISTILHNAQCMLTITLQTTYTWHFFKTTLGWYSSESVIKQFIIHSKYFPVSDWLKPRA